MSAGQVTGKKIKFPTSIARLLCLDGVFPDSLFVALFADGLQVHLVELGLDRHALVAGGAAELIHTPKDKKPIISQMYLAG